MTRWICTAAVVVMCLASQGAALAGGGIVYAPQGAEEGSGYGLEFYQVAEDGRLSGAALWFAGKVAPSPDVDTAIPHSSFTRRGYDSRWGLLYLFGKANQDTALIAGIGAAVVTTEYIDTSTVTGWTWDGGSDTGLQFQGQVSGLIKLGERGGLRLGWDSQFGTFVGMSLGL